VAEQMQSPRLVAAGLETMLRSILVLSLWLLLTEPARLPALTWEGVGAGGGGAWQDEGAIHPGNPDIVLAGTDVGGVYRTIDGGATWALGNDGIAEGDHQAQVYFVHEIVFDPVNPNRVYLGSGGLFKSSDGGAT
jgi:hypothetical protein